MGIVGALASFVWRRRGVAWPQRVCVVRFVRCCCLEVVMRTTLALKWGVLASEVEVEGGVLEAAFDGVGAHSAGTGRP